MKKILFISILLVVGLASNAQCNKELLGKAKSKLTDKEVFLNEFKIKLKAADINDPAPVAKFSQKFEEGKEYLLRIESDTEKYNSEGILRIFMNNKYLANTYSEKLDRCFSKISFKCLKTGDYKLLITFHNGKKGCAVVVVSEVE